MSLTFRYFNLNPGGFDIDLGNVAARLGAHGGFSMKAEAGEVGTGTVVLDDPDGTVGNAGDAILGLQGFEVSESDCAAVGADGVNGVILFSGYTQDRTYRRGDSTRSSLITGGARQIDVTLSDQNIYATWRINRDAIDGNRPAETDVERVQWLISGQPTSSAPFFYVTDDAGFIDTSNPVDMDACDYTGQTAADVLQDCAVASGKNWFILHWEATGNNTLWYADSNTSTAYASLLRISNVLSDKDDVTTFAPKKDGALTRDPTRVFAGVYGPFSKEDGTAGYAYQTNATTGDTYGWRDGSAPNSNIKTQAAADAVALRMVNDAATEDDHISCTVQLPSSLATGIKVGQRIQCRFEHLPDYEAWTWMRVTSLQIAQDEPTDRRYTLALELSPQTILPAPETITIYLATRGSNVGAIGSAVSMSANSYGDPYKHFYWHVSLDADHSAGDEIAGTSQDTSCSSDSTAGDGSGMDNLLGNLGRYGPLNVPLDTPIYLHGRYQSGIGLGTGYSDGATVFSFWNGGILVGWTPPAGLSITGHAETPGSGASGVLLHCGYFTLHQA